MTPPAPLLLGLGLVVGAAAAGNTAVDLVEIFKGGPSSNPWSKGKFACYRIPSLVRERSSGTLLAFGSERLSSGQGCNDEADTNLVLRRSTDGGATWSPMQLVVPAVPAGSSVANSISTAPWSMVDDATGDVLVFFNGNSTRSEKCACTVSYIRSTDAGASWGGWVEIPKESGFYGSSLTSGITLQTEPHKGRIITCMRKICKNSCGPPYQSFASFSDDHGKTWRSSPPLADGTTECQITELSSGALYMSTRPYGYVGGNGQRLSALSTDGGANWGPVKVEPGLVSASGVCGSVVSNPKASAVFYSHPDATGRTNMTLYRSLDDAQSWAPLLEVYAGGSAYSSMAMLDDSGCNVGLLFEKDGYGAMAFGAINACPSIASSLSNTAAAAPDHRRRGRRSRPPPPPPPPVPAKNWSSAYRVDGAIEVDTNENTLFWWKDGMFVLENIPCYYAGHAGAWDPRFQNASYARIRRMDTGEIVSNVSSTIGYGFVSAFTDDYPDEPGAAAEPKLWLFGSECNRCLHPPKSSKTKNGCAPDRTVQSWSSPDMQSFSAAAIPGLPATFNVEVSRVTPPQKGLGGIDAAYVMMLEPFVFAVHGVGSDLSTGWKVITSTTVPDAPSGGPSIRYNPVDRRHYVITGGRMVYLVRTRDFETWESSPNAPFIMHTEADAKVSPFAGFPAVQEARGFGPMAGNNWSRWDWNSNDADVCCMTPSAPKDQAWVVWGAGTQGKPPVPPLTRANHCANIVGTANMSLSVLLIDHFTRR